MNENLYSENGISVNQEDYISRLVACYQILLDRARESRQDDENKTTVRGEFGDLTRTAVENAPAQKPCAD